jgi:hypothetical protein
MKCINCQMGVAFGCKHCVKCLDKAKQRSALRYRQMKLDRRCKGCSERVGDTKGIYCPQCREAKKTTAKTRKAAGFCVTCGKAPALRGTQCSGCRTAAIENTRIRKEERLARGCCAYCDEPRISSSLCQKHYLQFASKTHFRTIKRHEELAALFDAQQGICPYSGRKLTLGVDASIDHAIPKSRGGSMDIENLQWVQYQVNFMKGDMLDEELFDLVRDIYHHMSQKYIVKQAGS